MPHKTREAIDEQQKQMQSSMTAEDLLQSIADYETDLDLMRVRFRPGHLKEEEFDKIKEEINALELNLINQFKKGIAREWFEKGLGEGIARKTVKGFDDTFEDYWNDFNQQ